MTKWSERYPLAPIGRPIPRTRDPNKATIAKNKLTLSKQFWAACGSPHAVGFRFDTKNKQDLHLMGVSIEGERLYRVDWDRGHSVRVSIPASVLPWVSDGDYSVTITKLLNKEPAITIRGCVAI